jgi:hypothetical protein
MKHKIEKGLVWLTVINYLMFLAARGSYDRRNEWTALWVGVVFPISLVIYYIGSKRIKKRKTTPGWGAYLQWLAICLAPYLLLYIYTTFLRSDRYL